ncbi:SDR family oxidoreductase [Microbacterium sp. SSW1-49]|uniref:SDR family oxidoreductase n=1 Tax=Microbacterium croceum TaxID=2851645 RepID=A0ABT0FDK4_9MICO|nr:SDR family oxidoreductase [Microbacterium croceum]MCK2036142.1 SDR family oxidoreductase [Microbacterium croceum]
MHITDFSLDHFSLRGRSAIVTGGNTGLGQAFTLALAKAGADVFVPTLFDDGGETADLVRAEGGRYQEQTIDITAPGAPALAVDACVAALGGVDILVNSAGISRIADVTEFGREEWDPMVAVNLTAAFDMAHEVAKRMIPQGAGKIINIASLFSFLGGLGSPAYAATKHGIVGLTRAYADELGGAGIQVNAIAPGYFKTRITEGSRSDPAVNGRIIEHTPAGRWGDVADLMGATVFLASPASDFVNGHVLTVDGGYLVR